jgi:nucleoside-diphosphate-sugar epimerase
MYMPDALRAIIELMEADGGALVHRNAFNVGSMSFTPAELHTEIRRHEPEFELACEVDPVRQSIADSWPESLDDSAAQVEWGWRAEVDLSAMTSDMLERLSSKSTSGG